MSRLIVLISLIPLFGPLSINAQLSGPSLSYGKAYKKPLHADDKFVNINEINFEYHQYLHRFWSGSVHAQHSGGKFNDQTHLDNKFKINSIGGTLSYWFLSDFRLLGKMARSSCKGKMVAMSYRFKAYLSAGLYGNMLKSSGNNISETYLSYSLGIGFNLWQFASTQEMAVRLHQRFMLIPFIKANYINSIKEFQLGDNDSWALDKLEFQIGVKFGFIGG